MLANRAADDMHVFLSEYEGHARLLCDHDPPLRSMEAGVSRCITCDISLVMTLTCVLPTLSCTSRREECVARERRFVGLAPQHDFVAPVAVMP